jgi:hypothetical protein
MLNLVQTKHGVFDLAIADPKATDAQAMAATVIYAALFTDSRASDVWVADDFDKRGWWDNPDAGSGLWYVRRQALSGAARAEAIEMVRLALATKTTSLTDVVVTDVTSATNTAGSVSAVHVEITGKHNGVEFLARTSL